MQQPITKIDVTPLVSVALILVIIFVVTSPLILAPVDSEIELPRATTVEAKSEENIVISVDQDLKVAINEQWIRYEHLERTLRGELSQNREKLVLVRADKHLRHKAVLDILHRVKRAGAGRVALATEQKKRARL